MVYRGGKGKCPRCDGELLDLPHDHETRRCMRCGGQFVTFARMRISRPDTMQVIETTPRPYPIEPLRCPTCNEGMRRTAVDTANGDVVVDYCDLHGLWFDTTELADLATGDR